MEWDDESEILKIDVGVCDGTYDNPPLIHAWVWVKVFDIETGECVYTEVKEAPANGYTTFVLDLSNKKCKVYLYSIAEGVDVLYTNNPFGITTIFVKDWD